MCKRDTSRESLCEGDRQRVSTSHAPKDARLQCPCCCYHSMSPSLSLPSLSLVLLGSRARWLTDLDIVTGRGTRPGGACQLTRYCQLQGVPGTVPISQLHPPTLTNRGRVGEEEHLVNAGMSAPTDPHQHQACSDAGMFGAVLGQVPILGSGAILGTVDIWELEPLTVPRTDSAPLRITSPTRNSTA